VAFGGRGLSSVLMVDHLLHLLACRTARPRLGQHQPIGRILIRMLGHPLNHRIGHIEDLLADDEP